MKFEKEMRSQMVPEWQGAYMDYTSLRLILEDLKLFKFNTPPQHHSHAATHQHQHHHHHNPVGAGIATLYRSFSGLVVARSTPSITTSKSINGTTTSTNNGHHHHHNNNHHHGVFHHDEDPVILVQSMLGHHHHDLEQGVPQSNQNHEIYETKFLMSNEDGGEYEVAFFKTLDEEFNAVNKFYRDKVDEVMNEAAVLTKQMDALVAFRAKVEHPDQGKFEQLCKEIARSASAFSVSSPKGDSSSTESSVTGHMEVIQESNETSTRGSSVGEIEPSNDDDLKEEKDNKEDGEGEEKPLEIIIPGHLEILSTVKINSPSGTARATIKGILKKKRKNNLSFNKKNLRKAEEQLQFAFVHFYHKLQLLKSFSYLNLLAFSKTMKKYDKITSRHASKIYLHMVDNSYIGSSTTLPVMDRKCHQERWIYTQYMETMFPLYSLFGFLVFHMLLYAAAIYFWRRYRINYPFIFGFKQGTELGYREVFLLSTILATAALACVLANLDMELDISTKKYKAITELLPLALVSVTIVLIIVCPFNIVYRSSRIFLLRTTVRAISAPLYRVTLSDFMLADQLSSQGQALRSVAFYICYYSSGDYKRRETSCKADVVYNSFYVALAAFPFWLRALQCFRRYFEEKDGMQGINGFKYLIKRPTMGLYVVAWICAISAAIVAIYWDIVFDWGLLQKNSKNPWLRDKLLVPHKSVYFGIMVMDVLLRFAWLQTVLNIQVSFLHKEAMVVVVACLEIFRRGVWNFFRIENEHLNNVGKFRAFTTVPLPFNYQGGR
ncbi:hypothetical protein MKW92_005876 [Papaver armeniacum]|nr:hypothetical protein MKW92_005876 [Papaver armeniacum]